jgi:putative hydrolase of the HAD superfamily
MAVRVVTWIFDLDNTLHDARPHIFPHINRSMTEYVERELALDAVAAGELRQRYWELYGATLLGLMRHHGIDPRHFLRETHVFDDIQRMLSKEPGLRQTLRRMRGRRIVFSNGPVHYARAVLKALRIADLFDDVISIERTRYRPKPDAYGFLLLLRRHRLRPGQCIMVEDSLENLRTAKKLGMRTVWFARAHNAPGYVDYTIRSIRTLRQIGSRLR